MLKILFKVVITLFQILLRSFFLISTYGSSRYYIHIRALDSRLLILFCVQLLSLLTVLDSSVFSFYNYWAPIKFLGSSILTVTQLNIYSQYVCWFSHIWAIVLFYLCWMIVIPFCYHLVYFLIVIELSLHFVYVYITTTT